MKVLLLFIFILLPGAAYPIDYKPGWNYENFYKTVQDCRTSIVLPGGSDYEKKGLANNKSKEGLRSEVIQVTPVLDKLATDICFCMINQIAKDKSYSGKLSNSEVKKYMGIPRCENKFKESMNNMEQQAEAYKLK